MRKRSMLFILAWLPIMALAQSPSAKPVQESKAINAITRAVVLANKPEKFTQAEWLLMMEKPVNRSLYPLRVTQAMLDTLDARALDVRFLYMMEGAE
jgi:hypothetical protein